MWTGPNVRAANYGGHALQRMKVEDWPVVMEMERLAGNKIVVAAKTQQPRPEQFGPCPCPNCTEKREKAEARP